MREIIVIFPHLYLVLLLLLLLLSFFFFNFKSQNAARRHVKYILRGTVVTLDPKRRVLDDGCVGIDGKTISFVRPAQQNIPDEFQNVPIVDVDGYIYPGLIDLHNHIAYNFLGLWKIDKKFKDRYQWSGTARYKREITLPTRLLTSMNPVELVKYSEVKALLGGVTTIGGFAKFNKSYAAWLLRNIEVERFGKQEATIYTSVLKLRDEKQFLDTRRKVKDGNAFLYHLAEGTTLQILEEYTELDRYDIISEKLVAIHCTALKQDHLKVLGRKKVKIVWSPLSNFLLYGSTTDVVNAKKHKVLICLGSDWSPSGSKNLLWELKVAELVNQESLQNLFSNRDIVEMVTVNPAKAIGWDDRIGSIAPGYFADLVVFERIDNGNNNNNNAHEDPYFNLIKSTEGNLKLLIIGGRPRYGDPEILHDLGLQSFPEKIKVENKLKMIDILEPDVEYGNLKLRKVKSNLSRSLRNPTDSINKLFKSIQKLKAGDVPLRLIPLEEIEDEINRPLLLTNRLDTFRTKNFFMSKRDINAVSAKAATLDPLTMDKDKDYFRRLKANPNVPPYLSKLKDYARR
jgi:5-methylthioadenosine/S-adenosylhomocysteine deaminase